MAEHLRIPNAKDPLAPNIHTSLVLFGAVAVCATLSSFPVLVLFFLL